MNAIQVIARASTEARYRITAYEICHHR
jgi:hypothetical protein